MSTEDRIALILRQLEADNPRAMKAYRLRAQVDAYDGAAGVLAADHPMAAGLVRRMALLSRVSLSEILSGDPPG